ncbi:MAG: hypothetical protein QOI30_1813 [Mycobacterium sp.]|jgi:hypothetical protein|nr:hypothetical protein [Mycobacterium sp.]
MQDNGSQHQQTRDPQLSVPLPPTRSLQVYAVDPSAGKYSGNHVTVQVPWEPLHAGPTGRKIAVIDYDATNKCYYPPIDLEHPWLLANDGLNPTEADPRFHQQMVYAIASRTIQMFEVALGREIHWRRADRFGDSAENDAALQKRDDIRVLKLFPHAMQEANAYYSPQAHGILFGFFAANKSDQGPNLPGQLVFTCLSQDIIAHEVTHAVIDGIRTYFTEPTNPDVLAFHEGFADLCALFSHFSQHDALIDAIRRTGGRLYQTDLEPVAPGFGATAETDASSHANSKTVIAAQIRHMNPLIQLAVQFGQASGEKNGLRSALGTPPNSDDIHKNVNDPHLRGSILVAAVFDAFFSVYMDRATELFHIYRAGGRSDLDDDLPAPLADLLCRHASQTAVFFFELCARSLDYCPPVDITFGDFLRAIITVSRDLDPLDDSGVRDALMEAFRLRGIFSESAKFYSEDALSWPPASHLRPIAGLVFGSPNGLTNAEKNHNGDVLRDWATKYRRELGLDPNLSLTVPSFHPVFRTMANGRPCMEMVVEIIQSRQAPFDSAVPEKGSFPFRAGVTLIVEAPVFKANRYGHTIAQPPEVRFAIGKGMTGPDAELREQKQRSFAKVRGLEIADTSAKNHSQANFGLVHQGF